MIECIPNHRFAKKAVVLYLFALLTGYSLNAENQKVTPVDSNITISIEALIQSGKDLQKTQPEKSIGLYRQAYFMFDSTDPIGKANLAFLMASTFKSMNNNDSALVYYEKAQLGYLQARDTLNMMKTFTMNGLLLQQRGLFKESAELFKSGINLFPSYYAHHEGESTINTNHLSTMMTNYGISLHNLGSFDSALYYHLQSYDIKVSNNSSGQAIAKELVNIGNVYSTMDKNPEAIDYFEKAKTQFMAVGDTFNLRKCFNNIGLAYKRMGDTIQAIDNYKYSEQLSRATNYPQGIATSLINLSSLYAGQNQTTQAELALKEAIKLSESIQDIQLISNATQNLASLYFKLGQNDQALAYALKAKDLAGKSHELDLEKMVFQLISQIYEAKGDYQQSLVYHKKYTTLHDSLFNVDNTQRFNELQTVFETAQKEQQIALMKNEQEKQLLETKMLEARQRVILGAAVAIILLFIVLVYNIIIRRKKDKEIHRQKELFHKKAQELSEAELEKRRIQEEELRQSVLYKSKQLSTHALHMMQKNTLLQEIQDDIKTLSKKVPANERMEYRRINQQINQSLRADNDWDVFKLYFEEVNRDFYTQLNEISPELTTNDHRLCALIKLNMNSKEMASVLNVAPNSIKSSRYRLKKKLGLDMEADLEEFIRSLS